MLFFVTFKGFDNNGGMSGPRSTRQSNPEEHASHYFNSFSKDMLVQVRFKAERTIRSTKVSRITPQRTRLKRIHTSIKGGQVPVCSECSKPFAAFGRQTFCSFPFSFSSNQTSALRCGWVCCLYSQQPEL